jgi:AP-2 complex subunit beta-1
MDKTSTIPETDLHVICRSLLADANPTVVANAVAALTEISDRGNDITLRLNNNVSGKLVAALGECSE